MTHPDDEEYMPWKQEKNYCPDCFHRWDRHDILFPENTQYGQTLFCMVGDCECEADLI